MSGKTYQKVMAQLDNQGTLHSDAHLLFNLAVEENPSVVSAITTQLSLKVGLKTWGDNERKDMKSEMKQLHLRATFEPQQRHELSAKEKSEVLESHMFIKLKRYGNIKGWEVAGGNKKRDFIIKQEASPPTVATKAVLLSCAIDAQEHQDVATIEILNAFIQTRVEKIEDMVTIIVRGALADFMVDIAPDIYGPYIRTEKKGLKTLILRCHNATYRTMVASLLYYKKFSKTIKHLGFKINPYDPLVSNRTIDNSQQTIC